MRREMQPLLGRASPAHLYVTVYLDGPTRRMRASRVALWGLSAVLIVGGVVCIVLGS